MLFKFACYFPAEEPLFLPINIELDAWVAELLKAIQLELQSLGREVSRKDLRLFKVNLFFLLQSPTNPQQADVLLDPTEDLQSRALQWLHQEVGPLPVTKKLASLFPNGPRLSDDKLDIIVADRSEE